MDMTVWLEYFVNGFWVQMNDVMLVGKKGILKDTLVQNHHLSERQGVIIEHILEKEKLFPTDFDLLCKKTGSVKRTLQRDLKNMIEKNIIESEGETNQKAYCLKKGI